MKIRVFKLIRQQRIGGRSTARSTASAQACTVEKKETESRLSGRLTRGLDDEDNVGKMRN